MAEMASRVDDWGTRGSQVSNPVAPTIFLPTSTTSPGVRSPSSSSRCCSTCSRSGSSSRCCPSSGRLHGRRHGDAAEIFGVFGTAWALMQFVFSPVLGALSDRYGRRPVILLSYFGLGLDYILMALAPTLRWLFVGRVISGITAASFGTAGAYIADVTPPEKRRARRSACSARRSASASCWGRRSAACSAASTRACRSGWRPRPSLVNAAYGLFVLPESLPPERRMALRLGRANPLGSLSSCARTAELSGLAGVELPHQPGARGAADRLRALHGLSLRLGQAGRRPCCWPASASAPVVVQGSLVGPACSGSASGATLLVGLLFGAAGLPIYGLGADGRLFLSAFRDGTVGRRGPRSCRPDEPAGQASEQGQLQGANSSSRGITGLIGPAMFTTTFAWLLGWLPGAPFLLAAIPAGQDPLGRAKPSPTEDTTA